MTVETTLIKKNEIYLIYKKIQIGLVAKSYMGKGFLILYMGNAQIFNHIYEEAFRSYMPLQAIPSEFPYI
jgi:hypothetical protein